MPIFVANSKRRKVFFRALVVGTLAFSLLIVFTFALQLIGPTSRAPLSQQDAQDAYLYYYSKNNHKKIALTFDDGPNTTYTEKVMHTLIKHEVPATFFFIGKNVLANPAIAREVANNGFAIGNHSFSHSFGVHNSEERLKMEIKSTEMLLERITGTTPQFYRPPFLLSIGVDPAPNPYTPAESANDWALALGYLPVGIDIDSLDWATRSKEAIIAQIKQKVQEGGHTIALFHDVEGTPEAVDELIPWMKEQGYTIVPLAEVLQPPTVVALTKDLKPGTTNTVTNGEVSQLQWFLYKQGFLDPYAMSGTYDEETGDAVLRFQYERGLVDPVAPDPVIAGIVEERTRQLIASTPLENPYTTALTPSLLKRGMVAIEGAYIYALSYIGKVIALVGLVAFSLIVVRMAVLALLLIYGKLKKKRAKPFDPSYKPLVTVLLPAYNEAENIRSAVRSVLQNTYPNKEIIVLDDGSTDKTGDIVEEICKKNPGEPLTLVRLENGGKARALRIGVELAHGELIAVVDGDAALDKAALGMLVRHFNDPKVGAVAGKVETAKEKTVLSAFQALEYAMGQNIDKRATSAVGAVSVVPGPAGVWRKSLLVEAGGFPDDTLVEDQDMTLTVLRMGYKVLYEPAAVTFTETPQTVRNFLKQRFRWVYGTIQCFWKHKGVFIERPLSPLSVLILPNIFFFGIIMPIAYPIIDLILVGAIVFGAAPTIWIPIALFTAIDMLYALWGVWEDKGSRKLVLYVPLQRFFYRQLLYYTVIKSVVRAIEGRGARWNKFTKAGETERYFYNTFSTTTPN